MELVGFWTPGYLAAKVAKVRAAAGVPLVLVVARALAVGEGANTIADVGGDRLVWCGRRPRVGEVMRVVERIAKTV